jgi:predicted Fe-S protein YdhL (DUF1289 family)
MITPCIAICKIDNETAVCRGCGRTTEEIRMWTKYTDEERMEVVKRLGYGKRRGRDEKLRRYDKG